jgi:hypothetical protein
MSTSQVKIDMPVWPNTLTPSSSRAVQNKPEKGRASDRAAKRDNKSVVHVRVLKRRGENEE